MNEKNGGFFEMLRVDDLLKPFRDQEAQIQERLRSLDSVGGEILKAKIGVLQRRREESLSDGDLKRVASLDKEMIQIQKSINERSSELNSLNEDLQRIDNEDQESY